MVAIGLFADFKPKFTTAMANASMGIVRSIFGISAVALLYFGGAVFACAFARLNGGFAMVWLSSAILAAWMIGADRRRWAGGLIACAVAHEIASGCFGIGWTTGLFLSAASMGEAVAAALLARYTLKGRWPVAPFEMILVFLIGTMLVIPVSSGLIAATAAHFISGVGFVAALQSWSLGHGVGLGAILPFGMTMTTRVATWCGVVLDRRRDADVSGKIVADRNRALVAVLIFATMALLCVCVFLQDARWTLLAPLLFAVFAAIWADALIATTMPLLVAVIAAPFTVAGLGPMALGLTVAADRLQLSLLYAGLIACCSLPLVVERARRRQEIARLSKSAAYFKAMSQRADNLIDELRRAVLTDPLTGLPNRRAFFDTLNAQAASDEPACLAMIDMDYFKQVNDRFGHATGDSVLVEFAEISRKSFRASDMVARIGGEEFAVILRGATIEQACQVVQRLVNRLAVTDMVTATGTVCVTISSGIAVIDGDGNAAMLRADDALYVAKRGGRSRLAAAA